MQDIEQPSLWFEGFEEYQKVSEPHKKEKSFAWTTAIGLQAVDGLLPSDYLIETAKRNIEGEISIKEANKIIDAYYESEKGREEEKNNRTEEADKVSARIAEILNDKTFSFKPTSLQNIHEKLFKGIYKLAGKIRDYNFTKKEWVLDNDTVYYTDFSEIKFALDYDFSNEKDFDYSNLNTEEQINHFSHFISGIWQIHPFCEGNTRTTAVFAIKYLNYLGFKVNNEPFAQNSWYFRNSLVRANYASNSKNIQADYSFLNLFFKNVLLNEKNELKNRKLHIYWKSKKVAISGDKVAISSDKVAENEENPLSFAEKQIFDFTKKYGTITNSKAQEITGLSSSGVRKIFSKLSKTLLEPVGQGKGRFYRIK